MAFGAGGTASSARLWAEISNTNDIDRLTQIPLITITPSLL